MKNQEKNTKLVIGFDVNGTLSVAEIKRLLAALDRKKVHVIVWSSMGSQYARTFCAEHDIRADECLNKDTKPVDIALDDLPDSINNASVVLGVKS